MQPQSVQHLLLARWHAVAEVTLNFPARWPSSSKTKGSKFKASNLEIMLYFACSIANKLVKLMSLSIHPIDLGCCHHSQQCGSNGTSPRVHDVLWYEVMGWCDADITFYDILWYSTHVYIVTVWYVVICGYMFTTHTYRHTYKYIQVQTEIQRYRDTEIQRYIHTYLPTYVRTYVCTYVHPSIHPSIHACMHAYMHTLHTALYIFSLCTNILEPPLHAHKQSLFSEFSGCPRV